MARTARKTTRKAKRTSYAARVSKASILAEEKQVGYETTDWGAVSSSEFISKVRETINHYNYFYDHKSVVKWAHEWAKNNLTKLQAQNLQACEDSMISRTACHYAKMMTNGAKFDTKTQKWVKMKLMESVERGEIRRKNKAEAPKVAAKKSPAELMKERASDLLAEIDEVIDITFNERNWDKTEFSMFDFLKLQDAPYLNAKRAYDYLLPQYEEFVELTTKKTDDLVEAYSHLGDICVWNSIKRFYKTMLDDTQLYMNSKKAVRNSYTKKKVKTASSQVQNLKYKKDSPEYKITSVDPTTIVGASQVILFNTRTRVATFLVAAAPTGFEVDRQSIKGVDVEKSSRRKLRNPDKFFKENARSTKTKLAKSYASQKTKASAVNNSVRVSTDMVIYKVHK